MEEANKIASGQHGRYDIRFVQSDINLDFAQNNQKHCLSIWAIDHAGNASNHAVEFIWKMIATPLAIDMNAARYRAYRREDDISWVGRTAGMELIQTWCSDCSKKELGYWTCNYI